VTLLLVTRVRRAPPVVTVSLFWSRCRHQDPHHRNHRGPRSRTRL